MSMFAPNETSKGGFLEDVNATVIDVKAVETDLNGNLKEKQVAIAITFRTDEGADHDEPLLVGPVKDFGVGKKPAQIVRRTDTTRVRNSAPAAVFVESMIASGFDVAKLPADDDFAFLKGMRFHLVRVPANVSAKYAADRKAAGKRELRNLITDKILDGEAPEPDDSTLADVTEGAGDEMKEALTKAVLTALNAAKDKKIARTKLFAACQKLPENLRDAAVDFVSNPTASTAWLNENADLWKLDGGFIVLAS